MGARKRNTTDKKQMNKGAAKVLTSHDRMREQLARDVEEFLARGGEIQHLEPNARSIMAENEQDFF